MMGLSIKIGNTLRGLQQRWGTARMKRNLWNREFSRGRWKCLEMTQDDFVYFYLEKFARRGRILDLGCGSGNTGNELNASAYSHYTGVDLSDIALGEAVKRTAENNRTGKNDYHLCDICVYTPQDACDVILFRESLFYVPASKVAALLTRYSKFLTKDGVFIVRMCDRVGYRSFVETIERNFRILETHLANDSNAILVVLR